MGSGVLDDVFALLTKATELESENRIEAATKYYEAVHMMKRYLERGSHIVKSQDSVNQLLTDKIRHYEKLAAALINDDSSTQSKDAVWSNARTPITVNGPSVESRDTAHTVGENSCSCTDFVFLNNTASQANTKLARALDLDESGKYDAAVAAYVEASESLLVALKAADKLSHLGHTGAQGVASVLKRRMTQTLDRVELLKKMKQNKVVNRQRIL